MQPPAPPRALCKHDMALCTCVYATNMARPTCLSAPDGHFVGLKKNRLANKDTFPCLVTCYLHNHMLRKGSETYMYYTGEEAVSRSKARPSRPIPRSMDNSLQSIGSYPSSHAKGEKSGYNRRRVPSFFNAIEAATGRASVWCLCAPGRMQSAGSCRGLSLSSHS